MHNGKCQTVCNASTCIFVNEQNQNTKTSKTQSNVK